MDNLTKQIAAYACGVSFSDLPDAIVDGARQRVLDSIGCALGGSTSEPVGIARRLVQGSAPAVYPPQRYDRGSSRPD
ncbi:MAG: MmgE/PrpD family protein [Rhodospirillales bacterium]